MIRFLAMRSLYSFSALSIMPTTFLLILRSSSAWLRSSSASLAAAPVGSVAAKS